MGAAVSRILIVDDDKSILRALRQPQSLASCSVGEEACRRTLECFTSQEVAPETAGRVAFDRFLSDYRMPVMDGVQFLKRLREIQPDATSADSFALRRPIKKHQGDIGTKSSEGNCFTFTVKLPVDSRNETPAGAANDQSL